MNPLPIANDITIIQCDDEVADGLSVFNLNDYREDIVISSDGFVNSTWNVSFFEDSSLQNLIDSTNYINLNNNQIIYASVEDESTGCTSLSEVTLQVNTSSGISASIEICDDFEADGFTAFDLSQADNQILSTAPVNASVSYYRSYNEALLSENVIVGDYSNEAPFNQVIYGRVDIDDSCYAINEVTLTVAEIPHLLQFESVYYCLNSFPETITLEGGILDDIPNNYAYNWSTGETTINIEVNETGTYEVIVTKPLGCSNRRIIEVLASSTAEIQTIEVTDLTENNTISVLVSGDGDYLFAIDNENGPYQVSHKFENVSVGFHTIYIKDVKANCGIVAEDVAVIGFPKFFTPNDDTVNDIWEIKGLSSEFESSARVEIFNRYGKLLKVLNRANPNWDGRYNGVLLPTDDYWFVAKFLDGRTYTGHFTLKR